MTVKVAEAIGDERGASSGGERGDQTGNEILVRTFKARSYPFTEHLSCSDRHMAKAAAEYAVRIASCARFGSTKRRGGRGRRPSNWSVRITLSKPSRVTLIALAL